MSKFAGSLRRNKKPGLTTPAAKLEATGEIEGNHAIISPEFSVPQHMKSGAITRQYIATIRGSYDEFAETPSAASWRPQNYNMFKSKTRYGPNVERSAVPKGDVSQAILIGMRVRSIESTFAEPVGVRITGCKGNTYAANGERYAFIAGTNQVTHGLDQIIASTNPYINSAYLELYPGYSQNNLREGIVDVPGESYVFVDHKHPIVEMMTENQETLQLDLANAQLVDNRWYKVSKGVTDRCLEALSDELVNNLPLIDFTKFKVDIERLDNLGWESESIVCDNVDRDQIREKIMNTQRHLNVVFEVTYAFP